MARIREDQCILSINELQTGCSQVMSLFPLCQTQDALLVPHGLELHGFPSSLLLSVPSTAQQIDFTRHNSSLLQIEWLICFCTTSVDFIFFFSLGLINTQKLRKAGLTLKGYACLTISGASSWFGALLYFASGKSHDKRWLSPGLSVACCMQAGGTIRLKGSSFLIVFHLL